MKRKIIILTITSLIAIAVLSSIEYYLVKTSYDYKVQEFRKELDRQYGKIIADFSYTDSLISNLDTLYGALKFKYLNEEIDKKEFISEISNNEIKKLIDPHLDKEFEKLFPDMNINFAQTLDMLVVYDKNGQNPDTILYQPGPKIEHMVFGTLTSLKDAFKVGTNTGKISTNGIRDRLTKHTFFISIRNWEFIVLRRMAFILIAAVLSILTVIFIFVYTLRSLIQQKKLTDIQTDFINNITHEFKTPLATLGLATATLKKQQGQENFSKANNVVNTIERQSKRLQKLLDQILENSFTNNQISLNKEELDLEKYIGQVISDFKLTLPKGSINLESCDKNALIKVDPFYFTTAILNLLDNAIKYNNTDKPFIGIKISNEENTTAILISDNGPGISKDIKPHIFEKFYRGSKGNIHDSKGLGLGLFYTKTIVEAHNGTIELLDTESGSTFKINIPK